jgi:hypothetical protein
MKTEFIKWYIIIFVCALILYTVFEKRVKDTKPHRTRNLIYCIAGGVTFGLLTLVAFFGLRNYSVYYFIVIQVLMLMTGIVHINIIRRILPWSESVSFWGGLLFSIVIACVGAIFMLVAFSSLNLTSHYFLMLSALLWFFIPLLFIQTIARYLDIPKIAYKKWYYPVNQQIPPPRDRDLASPVVITFEFRKKQTDTNNTVFRAKAPLQMSLGKLFFYFINDYNDRHPDTPVEIIEEDKAFGWLFYHKPGWFTRIKYLDADQSIKKNRIKENSIIVCKRVIES